ncbi:MAG TPA: hypothetical protein DCX25_00355 [Candidatus Pacebacteria bacterium]|nr:MAG: hypothetical protein UX00_C0003G0055 [Microgenomates group bacterium GW2011_GWB1_45_17]KKU24139.1 MAG: hypothetical protein UX36_C0002G0122 [Microgenomates group bacterium GW2011_GWC1_46_15]KKU24854.1 MAG: hypothetical protein UX35_C0001G0036 [Microgenomates group bacterium GW2011_GWA1_46_15]HAV14772.1 hypothetical protein [Candidatus Paceibacterota bacterium]HCR11162.1 hypothetical protein [Candidatus Paceibacterota bacterium]
MNTLLSLQEHAIRSAQENKWKDAISTNLSILDQDAYDVSALNRLGFCYIQTANPKKAKDTYERVIKIDKYNPIAKKYLNLLGLTKHVPVGGAMISTEIFIEEPGKTKTAQLCRLADMTVLAATPIGTSCVLIVKEHRIAVETDKGVYLGSLSDDFSHHLAKLLKGGNTYKTVVKAVNKNMCSVFIRELSRAKKLAYTSSFPLFSNHQPQVAPGLHDELLIEQDPLDLSETGQNDDDVPEDLVQRMDEDGGERS